jgi:very-short-patch-repair endonuclease
MPFRAASSSARSSRRSCCACSTCAPSRTCSRTRTGGAAPQIRADFLWRRQRLIVETDGWRSHGTRQGFERDRLRDQRARLAGWEILRFTRRQLLRDPGWVTATTGLILAR